MENHLHLWAWLVSFSPCGVCANAEAQLVWKTRPWWCWKFCPTFTMAELSCPSHPGGKGQKIILKKRKYVCSEHGDTPKGKSGRSEGRKGRFCRDHLCLQQMENEISSFAFWTEAAIKLRFQLSFHWEGLELLFLKHECGRAQEQILGGTRCLLLLLLCLRTPECHNLHVQVPLRFRYTPCQGRRLL